MRQARVNRKTNETDVFVEINLDGSGKRDISTGVGFFDHMLDLFGAHSGFDVTVRAKGDRADNHHMIEDVGICLGKAFYDALGDKRGIERYASSFTPMDEALIRTIIDISGRPYLVYDLPLDRERIGEMETEMVEEFFQAFVNDARVALHIKEEYGRNNHHIVEGLFKSFGQTLKKAVSLTGEQTIPSTKGVLE